MQRLTQRILASLGLHDPSRKKSPQRQKTARLQIESLEDRNVPAVFGTVSGQLFLDVFNTGAFKAGDVAIPGSSVTLAGTHTGAGGVQDLTTNTAINVTAVTDASGHFSFTNVPAGTYKLTTSAINSLTNGAPQSFTQVDVTTNGQVITHNFVYHGGVTPQAASLYYLVGSSPPVTGFLYGTPGSGTAVADHAPTVSTAISNVTTTTASANTVIDLAGNFTDADFTNSKVTFHITNGTTPQTVTWTCSTSRRRARSPTSSIT